MEEKKITEPQDCITLHAIGTNSEHIKIDILQSDVLDVQLQGLIRFIGLDIVTARFLLKINSKAVVVVNVSGDEIIKKRALLDVLYCRPSIAYINAFTMNNQKIRLPGVINKEKDPDFVGFEIGTSGDGSFVTIKERLIPKSISGIYVGDPCFSLGHIPCSLNCESCIYNFAKPGARPYECLNIINDDGRGMNADEYIAAVSRIVKCKDSYSSAEYIYRFSDEVDTESGPDIYTVGNSSSEINCSLAQMERNHVMLNNQGTDMEKIIYFTCRS